MMMINILLLKNIRNLTVILAKANLTSKSDIANFVKKTDFDDKLINSHKNNTSDKNELNEQSEKVKAISTKDFINKFSIFNRAKYFSSGIFQNY